MSNNIDKLAEGGRGIKIMSDIADYLNYSRTSDGKNCLSIVKNYPREDIVVEQDMEKSSVLESAVSFFKHLRKPQNKNRTRKLQKICLQVNTDLNALDEVLAWYQQLEHLPIPKAVWWQCKLALVEGFTNAVRHAHKYLAQETPIELEVMAFSERLEIKIFDYGHPFDFEAKLKEITSVKIPKNITIGERLCYETVTL